MFDIKFLREHTDVIKKNNERRGCSINVDEIVQYDKERRELQRAIDDARAQRRQMSKTRPSQETIQTMRLLGDTLNNQEKQLKELDDQIHALFSQLPNIIADDVPDGADDNDNVEIRRIGEPKQYSFQPADHLTIGERLDLIDVKRASAVAGSRFYYLKNEAALLRLALHRWGWEKLMAEGFTPMSTPHLAIEQTLYGTGYLPFFKDDVWKLEQSPLALIGTSEQTLVGYLQDEILDELTLPRKYTATSECFRTESGSYGKDTKGIFRVHEFWKMEQILFCTPQSAEEYHQKALAIEEWFVGKLELPYRVVLVCTGDCGAPGYKKYDIEAWFPSQQRYRELTSNTNLTDFQTRRLNIRYRDAQNQLLYPYTISATAITDRFIIAILENYQQEDGSVVIPTVLQPYMGIDRIRSRV